MALHHQSGFQVWPTRHCLTFTHHAGAGLEQVRVTVGAGTNTRDNPLNLAEFVPNDDAGGVFDNKIRGAARAQRAK